MTKPAFAICEQQRRRLVCASTQSDQRSCCSLPRLYNTFVSIYKISRLYLISVAEEAGLSLTWSQTPKTGFLVTWFIYMYVLLFISSSN